MGLDRSLSIHGNDSCYGEIWLQMLFLSEMFFFVCVCFFALNNGGKVY